MSGRKDVLESRLRLRRRRRSRRQTYTRLLLAGGVLCFALAAVLLARYLKMTAQTVQTQRELQAAFGQAQTAAPAARAERGQAMPLVSFSPPPAAATPMPAFAPATQIAQVAAAQAAQTPAPAMAERFVSLYKRNGDVVAWLKMDAVREIDFPVVHRDNLYYIDHDFYGRENAGGTAFLDGGNSILPRDENLIVHAHNMKNGTMFGKLSRLLDLKTLRERPLITFDTLYEQGAYAPYAVSVVSLDPEDARYFPLFETNFATEEARSDYVQGLRQLSAFALPVDVINGDELLTLATCHGKEDTERLVVAYRRLRPDETATDVERVIRAAAMER